MKILRTPDKQFANLSGYPFQPNYLNVPSGEGDGGVLRMHYLDEGAAGATADQTILLLHGEPSWSYLYRKMIPPLVAAGYRTIVPDLIGFGRSDKPIERSDYTYQRHVDWTLALIESLDLNNIVLFGQDWGGLIGLRLAAEHEARFHSIVAANTFLPTGHGKVSAAFATWRAFSQNSPVFGIGRVIQSGTVGKMSNDVRAAYNAPFPNDQYKAGARIFPALVPTSPDDPATPANVAAWEVLKKWEKPLLTLFSDSDPITAGLEETLKTRVPGAQGQPHTIIKDAGHFLQEDKGEEIAQHMITFLADK